MATVLLVEDDPVISAPLARALTREGYDVDPQATGEGAIDNAGTADLIVLDLGLPDMDGLEVARWVRAEGMATPILVLTASGCVHISFQEDATEPTHHLGRRLLNTT